MKKFKALLLGITALCASFAMTSCKKECEHQYGEWTVVTAATHTTEGQKEHECTKCGQKEQEAIPADANAHVWGEGVITTQPTHTEQGVKTFTCVCGETKTEPVAAIGHDVVTVWSKNETNHWHDCSCGVKLDEATHTWNDGEITTPATHTTNGVKTFTCTVCGQTKTEEIVAEGHKAPVGETAHTVTVKTDHEQGNYDAATLEGLNAGLVCDEGFAVTITKVQDGVYDFSNGGSGSSAWWYNNIIKLASSSKGGTVEFTLPTGTETTKVVIVGLANKTGANVLVNGEAKTTTAVMGKDCVYEELEFTFETPVNVFTIAAEKGKAFTIQAVKVYVGGQTLVVQENRVEPDCEHEGSYDAVVRCSVCNEIMETTHIVIPANGHDYGEEIVEVPATCTEAGTRAHYECATCHALFTREGETYTKVNAEDLVIPVVGGNHNYENKDGLAPTCTEEGYTAYQECSLCHDIIGKEVIPATGHTVPETFTYIESNETVDGKKVYYWVKDFTCPICETEHCQVRTDEVHFSTNNYTNGFKTLEEALATAKANETLVIDMFQDSEINGVFVGADQHLDIVINLHNYTLTVVSPAVGSNGYETQAFHFEKGNKVTIKNGTIVTPYEEIEEGKKVVKMGFQNYCDLTLDNITYDATTNRNITYAVSNNYGTCTINNCDIKGVKVLDCWYSTGTYEDGVKVVVKGATKLAGVVEYGAKNEVDGWMSKALLDLSEAVKGNLTIEVIASSNGFALNDAVKEGGIKLPTGVDSIYNGELHTHKAADSETAKVVFSEKGYENSAAVTEVAISENVKVTFAKGTGSNDPKYYTTGTAVRAYGGNTITIVNTTEGMKITSVIFKFSSGEGTNAITCNVGEYAVNVWTGSSNEVIFTVGGASGHRRIAEIEVVLSEPAVTEQINHVDATCCNPESYDEVTKCQICGEIVSTKHVVVENSQLQHQYGELIAEVAADCENTGIKAHYECASCHKLFTKEGEVYTEVTEQYLVIEALGHEYVSIAKEVTCTEDGYVENAYKCSVCNKYFVKDGETYVEKTLEEVKVESTGSEHPEDKFIKIDAVAPTCTTAGNNEYYHCECCGKYYKADKVTETTVEAETLPSLEGAHDFSVNVAAKDATCTEKGWTAHKECSICSAKNEEYQELELLPHTKPQSGEFVYVKVEDKWYKQYVCAECENSFVEETNEVVAVVGENGFASVKDAFASITTTEEVTITMIKDSHSGGLFAEQNKGFNITIDLGGYTLTVVSPAVGSNGTETQAFHFEKGNTITIKNGTIVTPYEEKVDGKKVVKMGFQNYCNLTLDGIEYDITDNANITYALSNCNGSLLLKDCLIIAGEEQVVFDAWFTVGYPEGVTVTVGAGTMLDGVIEYGANAAAAQSDPNWISKVCIVLTNADKDDLDVVIKASSNNFELKDANILLPNGVDCLINGVFHTHNYVEHAGLEATCTTKGYTAYTLCECGLYGVEKQEIEINPNNHNVVDLVCTRCEKHFKEEWAELTSTDQLVDGLEFIMYCKEKGTYAGPFNDKYLSKVDNISDAEILTFVKNGDNWNIKSGNDLIGTNAAKALVLNSGTNTWSISINNGTLNIISTNSNYGQIKYNSSSPRFCNYASGQISINGLYKTYEVLNEYTATVNCDEHASTSLTNRTIYEDEVVVFTVTPAEGYIIKSVKLGEIELVPDSGVYSFVVKGNSTITITTEEATAQYTINYAGAEHVTVTGIEVGTPVAKSVGETFTFTAEATEGYEIVVKANNEVLVGNNNSYSFVVMENTTITIEASVKVKEQTNYSYTFTSKSWEATLGSSTKNWKSNKDGGQLTANQGIQVTSSLSGVSGTCEETYANISKVVIKYCTNSKAGEGTIKVTVGDTTIDFAVTKPSSGGTTLKEAEFVFNSPLTGQVTILVECKTNSIYIYDCTIVAD